MKTHIGVDADSGLVHTVMATVINVNDMTQARAMVRGDNTELFGDAGYQGVGVRERRT